MELLINQVGYECDGEKSALLQCGADLDIRGHVRLLRQEDDHLLLETPLVAAGSVPGWQGRHYWRADFSAFTEPGHYRLEAVVTTGAQERLVPIHNSEPTRRSPILDAGFWLEKKK
ncbi:cellulase N-terminal Ig-like domain-containing protein, partial [Aeromonas caviae]|uniref:cellulase N-terminal Ig-like domain-containing protein n=1 Tax=Aeromonas caviae TaxID=648 RepID=UPI00265A02A7